MAYIVVNSQLAILLKSRSAYVSQLRWIKVRITKFSGENFKRLRAVEITPDGDIIELRGPNEAGKSSVMDGIWAALGGAAVAPPQPVRVGAEEATLIVTIGDLTATRKFKPDGSTSLTVEGPGAVEGTRTRYASPQAIMNSLVGQIAFDPLEFSRAKPVDQLSILRGLVKLDIDPEALDAANKADYEERTGLNRSVNSLRSQVDAIVIPDDVPDEPIDIADLARQLAEIGEHNTALERERNRRAQLRESADSLRQQAAQDLAVAKQRRVEAALLIERAEGHENDARLRQERATAIEEEDAALVALDQPHDAAPIQVRIRDAQGINAHVSRRRQKAGLAATLNATITQAQALTMRIAERDRQKREALARATFPVPNLSFSDSGVLYDGVPFEQASQAAKIKVSVGIAMAMNPRLRVLCVRDGSLLDRKSMAELAALVRANDYQLWIEVTDDDARTGVIIEDGAVVSRNRTIPAAEAPADVVDTTIEMPRMAGFEGDG